MGVPHSLGNLARGCQIFGGAKSPVTPEKIGIEVILVSKEADFFVEQHIQNPPIRFGEKSLALFAFLN